MGKDKISVISIECTSFKENQRGDKEKNDKIPNEDKPSPWNICHIFSVIAICLLFLAPVTLVPRTNSILYQSQWYEIIFCVLPLIVLQTVHDAFLMVTFLKGKSHFSVRNLLKSIVLYFVTWLVPYIIAYLVWCQCLKYNWPVPYLAYIYVLFCAVKPAALWASLSRDLRRKENFQRDFKFYILYSIHLLTFDVIREGVSILFKVLQGHPQWVIAFLIPFLKSFEKSLRSNLVNRMTGGQDEVSQFLVGLSVVTHYAFFIAVRLPKAEKITVCFFIAVDFFLQLKMTYEIVQLRNKIKTIKTKTTEHLNAAKQKMLTNLTLSELTEGMVPVIYATGISTGYYGYNGTILGDIKNGYWGYQPIDDIGYLFQIMGLLFGVDVLSLLINYFILSTMTNVNLFSECCRIMKKYWQFIAVDFATNMMIMFLTKDINLGMDSTRKFNWITKEGRIKFINESTDLSNEEKSLLLN